MVKDAVIVASHRFRTVKDGDWEIVAKILASYDPSKQYIVTCNGDTPMGLLIREQASARGFAVYEFPVQAWQLGPKYLWEVLYMARHAAMVELGSDFHLFVAPSRFNTIEDLVGRVKQANKVLYLYGQEGEPLETEADR